MKGMLKENSLVDKVILVTGGGSGLKIYGQYFLELGTNIIITSRRTELLNEVAKILILSINQVLLLHVMSEKLIK